MAVTIGSKITAVQWTFPYSDLETKDLLARVIYGEDTKTTAGQAAVAQVLQNRKRNPDGYNFMHQGDNSWAKLVNMASSVAQNSGNMNCREPNTSSTWWTNALALATKLINDTSIGSTAGVRYYFKASSYPSTN